MPDDLRIMNSVVCNTAVKINREVPLKTDTSKDMYKRSIKSSLLTGYSAASLLRETIPFKEELLDASLLLKKLSEESPDFEEHAVQIANKITGVLTQIKQEGHEAANNVRFAESLIHQAYMFLNEIL